MGNSDIPVNEFISETAMELGLRIQKMKDIINTAKIRKIRKAPKLPKKLQRGWI